MITIEQRKKKIKAEVKNAHGFYLHRNFAFDDQTGSLVSDHLAFDREKNCMHEVVLVQISNESWVKVWTVGDLNRGMESIDSIRPVVKSDFVNESRGL